MDQNALHNNNFAWSFSSPSSSPFNNNNYATNCFENVTNFQGLNRAEDQKQNKSYSNHGFFRFNFINQMLTKRWFYFEKNYT